MIVFITTGYGKNIVGGSDIWCNNFVENILPLVTEDYKIVVDGRPLLPEKDAIYTFGNDEEIDRILDECDKIVFLHHSYKPNPIIKKYLHKTHTTFVHAFIPDMLGLNYEYENLMTRLDWHWHEDVQSNKIGYAARCETRKNAHYLDAIPAFVFSNKYDYKRMLEGSKINADVHTFIEFDYRFHDKFFKKQFKIFHGCYTKEPFGYAIFDAIDNGKLPIIHSDWMKGIKYRYRAMNKIQFHYQYLRILEDGFEKNKKQFDRLKKGLEIYTDKNKWIEKVVNMNFFSYI